MFNEKIIYVESGPNHARQPHRILEENGVHYKLVMLIMCGYGMCKQLLDGPIVYCQYHQDLLVDRALRNGEERAGKEKELAKQKKLAGQIRKFLGSISKEELAALLEKHNISPAADGGEEVEDD